MLGGSCSALAALIFSQVERALPLYFLWLTIAGVYVAYQWQFALMPLHRRPERYNTAANVLLFADLAAHVAVGVFCGVGGNGVILLALSYFSFGKLAGRLAAGRSLKDIFRAIVEQEPDMSTEERERVALVILEQRRQAFLKSR